MTCRASLSRGSFFSLSLLSVTALAPFVWLASPLGAQEPPPEVLVETKLVASDGAEGDDFGAAIAIDGDVMVVAAPGADVGGAETSGAVYVFLRDPASRQWIEHQHLLPASGDFGDSFFELTLAIDGDTIVVGAPYTTIRDFQEGAVYVFERDQGGPGLWGEVARLADVSVDHGGHFGGSVALQGDLLVVGAPQDSSSRDGLVQIFERDRGGPGNWGRVTKLAHTSVNDAGYPGSFGRAVAIEGDLLLIGASRTSLGFNTQDGAAYIFRRRATEPDRWDHLGRLVRPGADDCTGGRPLSQFNLEASPEEIEAAAQCAQDNPIKSGRFGHQVAIEGDTVVVTAEAAAGDDGTYSVGAAYVYQRDPGGGDAWPHVATLSSGDASSTAYFGSALALAGDTVLIGAPWTTIDGRERQGAAYAFERTAGATDAWHVVETLLAYDGLSDGRFGSAVALDGAARIIGAPGDNTFRGAVYLERPPDEPGEPLFPPTGELVDGGIVEGPGGVLLGAVGAATAEPVPVWIHEVPAPVEPLFELAVPRGAFYNIGAVQTTIALDDGTFALALPVSEGDTAHLAAAMLVSAHRVLDGPGSGFSWVPLLGIYNPELGLFSVALDSLLVEGSVVVLIEHPHVAPIPPPPSSNPAPLRASDVIFDIYCYDFEDPTACGPDDIQAHKDKLNQAYDKFVALGFSDPALHKVVVPMYTLGNQPQFSFNLTGYIGNYIQPRKNCFPAVASYKTVGQIMNFCYDRERSTDEALTQATMHELFHAFQHSFNKMKENWAIINSRDSSEAEVLAREGEMLWIIEGTASAAEGSADRMVRADRQFHRVDVGLTSFDHAGLEYEAQDFWVYFGLKKGLGLTYLKPLFERGGTTEAAVALFAEDHQSSLAVEYWEWAKNQVMEKTIDFDAKLLNPCHIETGVIESGEPLVYPPVDAGQAVVGGALDRLTSAIVKIEFREATGPIRVSVDQAPNLRYKVYLEGEDALVEGKRACVSVAEDTPRTFAQVPDQPVYVLLSNGLHQPGARVSYMVRVEPVTTE